MKIAYYSDLHLEFQHWTPPELDAELVILAGDIHLGDQGVTWAIKHFSLPVLYVVGNHELYSHHNVNIEQIIYGMKQAAKGSNVHVLDDESVIIDGINFIGSTLWTDFNLDGQKALCMQEAIMVINDYAFIKTAEETMVNQLFTPSEAVYRHNKAMMFIENALVDDCSNVIITHHGVHQKCSHPKFHGDILSGAFNSDLTEFIRQNANRIDAIIYGHTHYNLDFQIAGVPIFTNQRGYAPSELVPDFNEEKYVDI